MLHICVYIVSSLFMHIHINIKLINIKEKNIKFINLINLNRLAYSFILASIASFSILVPLTATDFMTGNAGPRLNS